MVLMVFIRVHSGHQKYQYVRSIRATYHNKSHEFHNGDTFFIMSNFNFYISSKYHYYIFHYVISKYCQICKKILWNFSAESLDYEGILKKFENNPWVRITVLNYTVTRTYVLDLQYIGIVSWCSKWRFFL